MIRHHWKTCLASITLSSIMAGAPAIAHSQAAGAGGFPSHPVTMVVAYSAGGATDVAARTIAEQLGILWGESVVVENRPGAGGNIGASQVARAKPDGYTMIMVAPAHAINVSLYDAPGYRALEDFAAIGQVSFITNMVVAHPSFPANNISELIDQAKEKPGEIAYASGGVGTSEHLSAEYFQYRTGIKLTHIPYKGTSASVPDLLAGRVKLSFGNLPALLPHIRSGALKALAASSPERTPVLPDVPTVGETVGADYDVTVWLGLLAPAGTPADIVAKINRDLGKVLEKPSVKERLAGLGMAPAYSSPDAFRDLIASEKDKYAEVIKAANVKAN